MLEPRVRMKRLETRITAFEEQPIVKNMILFYGDSAFTRWKEPKFGNPNLEEVIRMKDGTQACVNHGFGSSTAEEQLYYYPRAVKPWEPRALVLQTIDNDVDYGYSPMEIMQLQARLMDYARTDFPGIRFYLCNTRPVMTHIGAPKVVIRRAISPSSRSSRRVSAKGSVRHLSRRKETSTLTVCEATVAIAAPAAPMPSPLMSSRSPVMLQTLAMATVMSGVRESPMPRMTLPSTL